MNLLFVHETDYINKVTYEWHTLAEGLAWRGHYVTVLDVPKKKPKENIEWISRTGTGEVLVVHAENRNRLDAFINSGYWLDNLLIKSIVFHDSNIDAVILYSVPTNGLQTIQIAHKYGIPVIFRSIDILHRLVKNPILRAITKQMEKIVYSKVDLILANTPNYAEYCRKMIGYKEKRDADGRTYYEYLTNKGVSSPTVKTLLMPVDTNFFKPMPKDKELMDKWGIKESDKVVLFMGSLNFDFCGLDEFIKEKWKQGLDAKLLVVGGGKHLEQYKKDYANDPSIIFTGYQNYSLLPKYINLADVCISTFIKSKETDDIFPGKVIQYLACGKPVVATKLKGLESLDIAGGVVFVENHGEMVGICVKLLKDEWSRSVLCSIGKLYAKENHNQELILDKLESEIKEQVESHGKV